MGKRDLPVSTFELMDISERSGPGAAATRARELLAEGRLPANTTRAELLADLGRYLERSGEADAAEAAMREAVAGAGAQTDELRVGLAGLLARRGDRDGCDDVLAEVWRSRPADPFVYLDAAELLNGLGDQQAALRWANTGAFRQIRIGEELSDDALALLATRWELRRDTGFPEDEYDLLAIEWLDEDDVDDGFDPEDGDEWDVPSQP